MVRRAAGVAALAAALVPAVGAQAGEWAKPARIVSLNLCTDQLVIGLADRGRIAAVSHLAADEQVSAVAAEARGLAVTRGEAESVLAFDPDLVLAGGATTPATLALLARIGRRVERVADADDLDGVRRAIRQVAAAIGETARGEAMVEGLKQQLREASRDLRAGSAPSALVYQVNGLSAGTGTLADALLSAAGLVNHARRLGLGVAGTLPLEVLAARPPDLIVLTGPADEYRTVVADNLRHPVLAAVMAERSVVVVPWRLWLCGTAHIATAVARLAGARRVLAARAARP